MSASVISYDCVNKYIFIVPTLRVGMRPRTLQRPRFNLCFIDVLL